MVETPRAPRAIKTRKELDDWRTSQSQIDRARAEANEQRRNLWDALNNYIAANNGWIVSPPGAKTIRIEVPAGSTLPAKLAELGHKVCTVGSNERITPTGTVQTITDRKTGTQTIRRTDGIINVDILEISLGK